jgi:hypothetical protein
MNSTNSMNPSNSSNSMNALTLCALLSTVFSFLFLNPEVHAMQKTKHIVLLGASVGKAWNIESLPDRLMKSSSSTLTPYTSRLTSIKDYRFEYFGEYQFDKSKALQQILQRKENRPDAIFIKECATYFPGDLPHYQELMKVWIKQCKEAKVIPIPTTVVSVKDYIKEFMGKSPSILRLTSVLEYNDWIKFYAKKESLVVLDLETPLRTSNEDRSLKIDLHSGDGLHLNEKAYSLLDQIVLPTLDDVPLFLNSCLKSGFELHYMV